MSNNTQEKGREIKFRAWDRKGRKWLRDFSIHETGAFLHLINSIEEDPDVAIMQFTGLCDKNGVEIYESDIISYGTYKQVVKHKQHEDADGALVIGYGFASPSTKAMEVIGNIYQHPELLK